MILQALARYYEILANDSSAAADGEIAPPGYSVEKISFAILLSRQGELLGLQSLFERQEVGNKIKELPRILIVPASVKRSVGIAPNFLWDNSTYVLGLANPEEEAKKKDPNYSRSRFEAFRKHNIGILQNADSDAARAVIAFLERYTMEELRTHTEVTRYSELPGKNLTFMVEGKFAFEDAQIRQAWEKAQMREDAPIAQCLVTGERAPIARLHPASKGVRGAQSTGASLVGFNARAYESYGREQGMISPVSEQATFAYSTALNYLLSPQNPNRAFAMGDTTVVYWADSPRKDYAAAFQAMFDPEWEEVPAEETAKPGRDRKAEQHLKQVAEKVRRARPLSPDQLPKDLDPQTRFYVLGLSPNAGRLSVRFFYADAFGKIVDRIQQHYRDMEMVKEYNNQPTYLTVRDVIDQTIAKKATNPQAAPLLAGAILRSILTGAAYPAALYTAILTRIRADSDDRQKRIEKIGYARAAILKACLLRKYRHQPQNPYQEVLCMSLNEQSTLPAYVLGRLFAVLEKAQQEAIPNLNATIKDRYFTAACAAPASVFPILLRLSQHYTQKAEYGRSYDRRIQDLLNLLDLEKNPFPAHLTLDEQGIFILGYYQQRAAFYVSKSASAEVPESETH